MFLKRKKNALKTEENRQTILKKYPKERLYVVTQNYVANEKQLLKQNINDIVGLMRPHDSYNHAHICLVDNGEQEGFIPFEALTPYEENASSEKLAENLIDFNDSNSSHLVNDESKASSNLAMLSDLIDLSTNNEPMV